MAKKLVLRLQAVEGDLQPLCFRTRLVRNGGFEQPAQLHPGIAVAVVADFWTPILPGSAVVEALQHRVRLHRPHACSFEALRDKIWLHCSDPGGLEAAQEVALLDPEERLRSREAAVEFLRVSSCERREHDNVEMLEAVGSVGRKDHKEDLVREAVLNKSDREVAAVAVEY